MMTEAEYTTMTHGSGYTPQTQFSQTPQTSPHKLDNIHNPAPQFYNNPQIQSQQSQHIYRIGNSSSNKPRPVVVTFLTQIGRDRVYQKEFTESLRLTGSKTRVSEHFPSVVKEKHTALIQNLIELKKQNREQKITLKQDAIFVNNKKQPDDTFERNPLSSMTPSSINYEYMEHSKTLSHRGSSFTAHSSVISNKVEAMASRNAIFQNPALSISTHVIYAYKTTTELGTIESGFSDDGESTAGNILMKLINVNNLNHIFLAVTREKRGPNIGKRRFELIEQCAKNLLSELPQDKDYSKLYRQLHYTQ